MSYQPGELDQSIVISRGSLTADGIGGNDIAWVTVDTVWAKVMKRNGNETEQAMQIQAEGSYTFVIRYRNDLLEKDKITWDGADYNITFIQSLGGRKLYLEIEATRGVPQ